MDRDINKETNKREYEQPQMEMLRFEAKENLALSGDSDVDGPGWGPWV